MIILEVILAMTLLFFAMILMGKILVADFQILKYFSNKVSQFSSVVNCCRYLWSSQKAKQLAVRCPQSFLQANSSGSINVQLIGRSCHVSWEKGDNHGIYRMEV